MMIFTILSIDHHITCNTTLCYRYSMNTPLILRRVADLKSSLSYWHRIVLAQLLSYSSFQYITMLWSGCTIGSCLLTLYCCLHRGYNRLFIFYMYCECNLSSVSLCLTIIDRYHIISTKHVRNKSANNVIISNC